MSVKKVDRRLFWGTRLGVTLALGLFVGFFCGLKYEKLEFVRVIDGDTLVVLNRRDGLEWRVRLWGVNAPDTKECYFDEATKILEKEITAKKITFDRQGYDSYGRILAKVYVGGVNVEEILVATGAAVPYDAFEVHDKLKPSAEYVDNLRRIEEVAREGKWGVWSEKCTTF